jgi:hypothetical protein
MVGGDEQLFEGARGYTPAEIGFLDQERVCANVVLIVSDVSGDFGNPEGSVVGNQISRRTGEERVAARKE